VPLATTNRHAHLTSHLAEDSLNIPRTHRDGKVCWFGRTECLKLDTSLFETMSANNNNNAPPRSRASRKRARAAGNASAPLPQAPQKKRRTRQRNAKRGRAQTQRGAPADVAMGGMGSFFAPVAQGTVMRKAQPMFTRSANEQRIIHREKVAKVVTPGSGAFTILKSIALNPGMALSFPWLSNEAAGYETYRFNRLRFVWVPSVGTGIAGNLIMGPDYDAADPSPASETALSAYTDVIEANLWIPFAVECEPDLLNGETRRKYIRNGALAANQDVKTYDSGNFFAACSDDGAANTGKLWVEYDVTLYNPHVPPGGFFQTGALVSAGGTIAAATPFGAVPVSTGAPALSAAGVAVLTFSGMVIGEEYALTLSVVGTVITVLNTTGAAVGRVNKTAETSIINAGATAALSFETFTATAETASITVTVTATTVTSCIAVVSVLAPIPSF